MPVVYLHLALSICLSALALGSVTSTPDELLQALRDGLQDEGTSALLRWAQPGAVMVWPRSQYELVPGISGASIYVGEETVRAESELSAAVVAGFNLPTPVQSVKLKNLGVQTSGAGATTVLVLFEWITGAANARRELLRAEARLTLVETSQGLRIQRIEITQWEHVTAPGPLYTDATDAADLAEANVGGARTLFAQSGTPNLDTGGLAVGDVDGDGWLDIFVVRDGLKNQLYLRRDKRFVEAGVARGVADMGHGRGALFFDPDGDADLDLFVTARGGTPNRLYQNDGHGFFTDVTQAAGLASTGSSFCAAAADVDGDDDLDLYVCRYGDTDRKSPASFIAAQNGEANLLYLNQGDGTFVEAAKQAGVDDVGWSYAAAFADFDDDGDMDFYLANDFGSNRLFQNDGRGRFTDVAPALGAADPGNGMSVNWADLDNDGDSDLLVSNMFSAAGMRQTARHDYAQDAATVQRFRKFTRGNTVLVNDAGRFVDRSVALGLTRAGWAWGAAVTDIDRDGWLDVYVANGYLSGEWAVDI